MTKRGCLCNFIPTTQHFLNWCKLCEKLGNVTLKNLLIWLKQLLHLRAGVTVPLCVGRPSERDRELQPLSGLTKELLFPDTITLS